MALRNQQTLEVTDILLRDKTDGNAFASGPEGGAAENVYYDQGKLVRASYMPAFHASHSDDYVWAIREFNFTRDNAPEKQLLIFKSNGRIYKRIAGEEHLIYPAGDAAAAGAAPDSGYAGTGATVAGSGAAWSNASNITGAANAVYAVSASTGADTSSGPNTAGTGADDSSSGTVAWSNPGNITSENSAYAEFSTATNETSHYLNATNFSFSIPTSATILGIQAEVKVIDGNGNSIDATVKLIKSGSQVGNNLATGNLLPYPSIQWVSYGSSTELWGTTWTPANINASNFGVAYQVSTPIDAAVLVDAIRITVYYSIPKPTDVLNATNYGLAVAGEISGITVKITGHVNIVSGAADSTMAVQLIGASGIVTGEIKSQLFSSTSDVTLIFGSSSDKWNASWTETDINDADFGVQIICTKSSSPVGIATFSIDSVQILVEVVSNATVSASLFTKKPSIAQLNNRLHISDGRIYKIYDGWDWYDGGLAAPTNFDSNSTSLSGTGLTGTYDIAVTAVHIRNSNGTSVRVHESNHSGLATESPSNQSIVVDVSSVVFPSRATHWSVYIETPASSGILRRVATTPISTTTYTITAEPAANAATAPERNDPVQPTRILTQWKNRLAGRSETNPDQMWFTAFGEVNGLLNGAGEECMSGRLGTSSLSDLINQWQIPDGGQPMECAIYHREHLWVFTDRSGFEIVGTGALQDNIAPRDFYPQRLTSFGAAGPTAALSTPFGIAVVSHEHKLWFRRDDGPTFDIGHDIQSRLDDLTKEELNDIEMCYWSGEGWDWLLIPLPGRIGVFDFSLATDKSPVGSWLNLGSQGGLPQPTSLTVYHPNKKFLLSGHNDGSVHQLATLCQPAHLGLSFTLGNTYLGSSVQNSPIALARTGPLSSDNGKWTEWKYVQLYHRGHTDVDSISTTDPTITAYYDQTNPAEPSSGIALSTSTVSGSNERRAYFKPSSSASAAGALARKLHVEMKYTTTNTDGASRPQLVNNEILSLTVVSQPKSTTLR